MGWWRRDDWGQCGVVEEMIGDNVGGGGGMIGTMWGGGGGMIGDNVGWWRRDDWGQCGMVEEG